MNPGIVVVATLYLRPGREAEFREFETQAARLVRQHGGRLERVIRASPTALDESQPYEVHLVWFPSAQHFQSYRNDPGLADLATLRQAAIAKTTIVVGEDAEPYGQ